MIICRDCIGDDEGERMKRDIFLRNYGTGFRHVSISMRHHPFRSGGDMPDL